MANYEGELKAYKKLLKGNEAKIVELTKINKHVKEHIKFLQLLQDGGEPSHPDGEAVENVLRESGNELDA